MARTIRGRFAIRALGVSLLIAVLLAARFASRQHQTAIIYAAVACGWIFFFFLGVKAVLVRKLVSGQIHNPRLFALAARPQEEWFGLTLAILGALILAFGQFTVAGTRQDWSALGGIVIFIAWYFIWRGAYAISLNKGLHYSSLFGGYREIEFEEIASAKLVVGFHPTRPTVRLEVYPINSNKWRPIIINRAIFRRADMDSVVEWLASKIRPDAKAT